MALTIQLGLFLNIKEKVRMKCNNCGSQLNVMHSISRFNQKIICPKCDVKDALWEDQLRRIVHSSVNQGIRLRRSSDQMDFALKTI